MANKKKQFSPHIYPEWGELFDAISPEERSELLLAITKFPEYEPKNVSVWNFIKSQLQKDYEMFIDKCESNSTIIKNYWQKKKQKDTNVYERITNENECFPKRITNNYITNNELRITKTERTNKNSTAHTKDVLHDLSEWHGEYTNVHLTKSQYDKLLNEILNKEKLAELINELSENIACKKSNAPPYDDKTPDMHYAILRKYWKYRKQNIVAKPNTNYDKAQKLKQELDALAEKYRQEDRLKELNSG